MNDWFNNVCLFVFPSEKVLRCRPFECFVYGSVATKRLKPLVYNVKAFRSFSLCEMESLCCCQITVFLLVLLTNSSLNPKPVVQSP